MTCQKKIRLMGLRYACGMLRKFNVHDNSLCKLLYIFSIITCCLLLNFESECYFSSNKYNLKNFVHQYALMIVVVVVVVNLPN